MPEYKAPLRDMQFVLEDLLDIESQYRELPGCGELNMELVRSVLEEGARINENEYSPLNPVGDAEGCRLEDGQVRTPAGFREAYAKLVEGGWIGINAPEAYGGQGLPYSMSAPVKEMQCAANFALASYSGLTEGAIECLEVHADDTIKRQVVPRLVSGEWAGTMCLTEAHCGSDLGQLRTRAEPQADGTYKITGTKIFITGGDQDLTANICHIVLARLPDAPDGTKGISLFLVPKRRLDANGEAGEMNRVSCGSLEHKMGIRGSATCVMNFDGAEGYLVGEPNRGLNCMFTFMNTARLGTGMQGLGMGDLSYQGALRYARERLAMRALSGPKYPDLAADPIIVHPDVRRMLLTQKALAEGCRALAYYCYSLIDVSERATDEAERKRASDLLGLLTPICKAFMTETGFESVNLGLQVFGGHGFIVEWGMEQLVRDCRISTLYEGTTGIQALDLLGRKVLMTQGELLRGFTREIHLFCKANQDREDLREFVEPLAVHNREWGELTTRIGMAAMKDRDEVGSASVDYLMYSGYTALAWLWARMARVSLDRIAEGADGDGFYTAKLHTAQFYFAKILPRTRALAATMQSGADSVMRMEPESFSF